MDIPPAGKEQRSTVEQALDLLDKLDERGDRLQRRAAKLAWASTFFALVLLAAISVTIYGLERRRKAVAADLDAEVQKLNDAQAALSRDEQKLSQLHEQNAKLEEEIKIKKEQVHGYDVLIEQFPAAQVKEVSKKLPEHYAPRVYLQIVDQADRAEAEKKGEALEEHSGGLVLGVEYVPGNRSLKATEVRFYKAADLPEAQKLADILKAAGVGSATTKHLKQMDRPDVKGRTFEVWFAQGLR